MAKPTRRKHEWKDEYTLLCERCGYVIEGLDQSLPCPECGKPIAESVPFNRIGTPWQWKPHIRSLFSTLRLTVLHPIRAIDTIRFFNVLPKEQAVYNISASVIIILLALGAFFLANTPHISIPLKYLAFFIILIWGILWALTALTAKGLQILANLRGLRMPKQIAWVIVAHGSAGWVVAAFGVASGIIITSVALILPPYTDNGARIITVTTAWTALIVASIIASFGIVFFIAFAYLGLRRCKYANRPRPKGSAND